MIIVKELTKTEPWNEEGNKDVNSLMAVPFTELTGYSCRVLQIKPGGYTGMHSHGRIHQVLLLNGKASVETDREVIDLNQETMITVPADMPHRFINKGLIRATLLVQNLYTEKKG